MQIDRKTGLRGHAAIKLPVKVATTGPITISGHQTIDGVSCVTGDRVLVKDQTDAVNNGVFIVDTGTWNRAPDFDGANDIVKGTLIAVVSGTVNGPSFWQVTTDDPIVPDTSEIEFALRVNALSGVSAFVQTLLDDTTAAAARATLGVPDATETLTNKTLSAPTVSGKVTHPAVSNYVSGTATYLHQDGANSTSINVRSLITEGAFESIGPTGSGATNIWTAMDDIPAGARIALLLIRADAERTGTTDDQLRIGTNARMTGSAETVGIVNEIAGATDWGGAASNDAHARIRAVVAVPLDASRRFDFTWTAVNETGTPQFSLFLRGFVF